MNPCPCGHLGDPRHACTCLTPLIERYRSRIPPRARQHRPARLPARPFAPRAPLRSRRVHRRGGGGPGRQRPVPANSHVSAPSPLPPVNAAFGAEDLRRHCFSTPSAVLSSTARSRSSLSPPDRRRSRCSGCSVRDGLAVLIANSLFEFFATTA
ncbi:MAG TPA: ATP-binding protein [Thermoanaerobaculia bacterium]|nr:ATP-binding protein [Thermoanaerobaculia bacterium]